LVEINAAVASPLHHGDAILNRHHDQTGHGQLSLRRQVALYFYPWLDAPIYAPISFLRIAHLDQDHHRRADAALLELNGAEDGIGKIAHRCPPWPAAGSAGFHF
jgi:hypothetical protein